MERCTEFSVHQTSYHTFTHWIIYLWFLISPDANETHHSLSSRCLISITFSPPLTSASQTPLTPASHLLPPAFRPLLYYPAGIALGTLQSCDPTPVTSSDSHGKQRTMVFVIKATHVWWFSLRYYNYNTYFSGEKNFYHKIVVARNPILSSQSMHLFLQRHGEVFGGSCLLGTVTLDLHGQSSMVETCSLCQAQ